MKLFGWHLGMFVGLLSWCVPGWAADGNGGVELEFLYFQEQVQPVLLAERVGAKACASCHARVAPRLVKLADGSASWNNEQSRENFAVWREYVVAGEPSESTLLTKPLAAEAGGSGRHGGGVRWKSKADPEWQTLAAWVRGQRLGGLSVATASGGERAFVRHSDGIAVIHADSGQIVGSVEGAGAAADFALAPDGTRLYVANGAASTLDIVDMRTLRVFKSIGLSGPPRALAASGDGETVYAGIAGEPGVVDVVGTRSLTRTATIDVGGPVDDVSLTPDGTHLFVWAAASPELRAVDTSRREWTWRQTFAEGLGGLAFLAGGDGSTRHVAVNFASVHGFSLVDFARRKVVRTFEFPDEGAGAFPARGIAVDTVAGVVWAASPATESVYAYGIPENCVSGSALPGQRCEWELLGGVELGARPKSLALSGDGKELWVALAVDDAVAVVDAEALAAKLRIRVGQMPGGIMLGEVSVR